MPDSHSDRRASENEPLRDAFDALVASLEQRQGDAVAQLALGACASHARRSGVTPERFIATLKRLLDSRPEVAARLASIALFRRRRSAYEEIVTWAIKAYFDDSGERASGA
jgi:hypothetical protein